LFVSEDKMIVPPAAMIGCILTEISVYTCHLVVKWKTTLPFMLALLMTARTSRLLGYDACRLVYRGTSCLHNEGRDSLRWYVASWRERDVGCFLRSVFLLATFAEIKLISHRWVHIAVRPNTVYWLKYGCVSVLSFAALGAGEIEDNTAGQFSPEHLKFLRSLYFWEVWMILRWNANGICASVVIVLLRWLFPSCYLGLQLNDSDYVTE